MVRLTNPANRVSHLISRLAPRTRRQGRQIPLGRRRNATLDERPALVGNA